MRRKRRLLLGTLLVLLLMLAACGGGESTQAPATEEQTESSATSEQPQATATSPTEEQTEAESGEGTPYKIGFVAAITGPGASLGVPERNTAEMIAAELEAAGGIEGPDGVKHPVEIIILDSESNPDKAAAAASRLIDEEQVDVLVAGTLSGNSLAMVPLASEAKVPMISMAAATSIIVDPETGETRPWIFKTPQTNGHSARWQAEYLQAKGITKVCYLYENSGFGQDTLNQGTAAFESVGIEIVYADTFERSDTEFPQVVSVQGSGCEAVVIGSIPPGASLVQQAIKDAMPDMLVLQGHGVCNQTYIDLAPEAVEGTFVPCSKIIVADQLPEDTPERPVILKYIESYSAYTGEAPNAFGGYAHDALRWAIEALGSIEEGHTLAERRAAVREYIETNIRNWPGVTGVFTITPEDHLGLDYTALAPTKIENSAFKYFPKDAW
ncbi:MAG: ABC transporter substrate-binding protein [Ardenticatenia bacterium]|nr:MAG: ABC transporter substrate-binding protein [Ardenticatenia bacterium]